MAASRATDQLGTRPASTPWNSLTDHYILPMGSRLMRPRCFGRPPLRTLLAQFWKLPSGEAAWAALVDRLNHALNKPRWHLLAKRDISISSQPLPDRGRLPATGLQR